MNKLKSVEGIRGLACLMVLLSHLMLMTFPYLQSGIDKDASFHVEKLLYNLPIGFIYSGSAAVYIFFTLSGFILTYAITKNDNIQESALKMLSSRYFRLMIPSGISILICYLMANYYDHSSFYLPWIEGTFWNKGKSFIDAIFNAVFGTMLFGDKSYNVVTWTMQVEFYGSLLIFTTIPLINTLKRKSLILAITSLIFVIYSPASIGTSYACFFVGSIIFYAQKIQSKIIPFVLIISGLYLAGFRFGSESYVFIERLKLLEIPYLKIYPYFMSNMLAGALIVYSLTKSDVFKIITDNKFSVWLGKVSFSAYLIQIPIFYSISQSIYYILLENDVNLLAVKFITIITSLFVVYSVSEIFYRLIDMSSVKASRRIGNILLNYIR
ncbi:acyltransferase [Hafnia alvei]|uniref:Acyltransferase family n=2 Tax=Hafnia alvei TaxID=569 RepID=A0A377PMH2_HAFAL|nr:acyltransferase [Hafnia alvei]KFC86003.1 acyltransferase [Hafnia alvei ATCC 13337]MEB7889823.1 acyltransferase [Hafnia alvei]RLR09677.1 acyltransferase [Hafnia alvei ATCC 13337]WQD24103.1 acyltransferase [Hafnia alvei]STQ81282.1 Acyltransferase family [Hafnia alvei]